MANDYSLEPEPQRIPHCPITMIGGSPPAVCIKEECLFWSMKGNICLLYQMVNGIGYLCRVMSLYYDREDRRRSKEYYKKPYQRQQEDDSEGGL